MSELLITILNMSFSATIAALVIIIARMFLGKSPKILSYALWGVVLFHLVCPFTFESVIGLLPANSEPIPQDIVYTQTPTIQSGIQIIDNPVNAALTTVVPPAAPTNSVNPVTAILEIASIVWLCGVIALLLYSIISYIRLKRRVFDATLLQDNIYETDRISTAFVLGFISPKIYVPLSIEPVQLSLIREHENAHIKRRDYLIKPIAFVALALHWFNPIMWVSYFLMIKDMEMSCDESVLRRSNGDIRQAYSMSLLQLSSKRSGIVSPLAFGENDVKPRVKNILNFRKPTGWIVVISIVLVAALSVGLLIKQPANAVSSNRYVAGDIASVDIITYPSRPEYDRYYSSPTKISAVTEYLNSLDKTYAFSGDNQEDGGIYEIIFIYKNGEHVRLCKSGNRLLGIADNETIHWYNINYDDGALFDNIIRNNASDDSSSRTTAPLRDLSVDLYSGEFDMIWELKAEGYKDLPLNQFNAAVQAKLDDPEFSSAYDKLVSVLVPGSNEYQFITETFGYSVAENISPLLGHPIGFSWNLTKYEDPYSTGTGEIFHNFMFTAFYSVEYRIKDMAAITVGERDELIATYQSELQNTVRAMSKDQLRNENIQWEIQRIAENLEKQLSTSNFIFENAEITSIELLDYPAHGDQQIYSSDPVSQDFSVSLSPDGKTRLEWNRDRGSNVMHIANAETGQSLDFHDYPSDSQLTVVWRNDSKYAAVGYTNSDESRIIVYDTDQGSSAFGKEIYSHEFASLYREINPGSTSTAANLNYLMQPTAFNNIINNNSTSLIYLVSWDDENGNRLSRTINWNFINGEYSFITATTTSESNIIISAGSQDEVYVDLSQRTDAMELSVDDLSGLQLSTNSEKITVSIPRGDYACTVELYGATPGAGALASFELNQSTRTKTFTNLTSATSYFIEITGLAGNALVTVTD